MGSADQANYTDQTIALSGTLWDTAVTPNATTSLPVKVTSQLYSDVDLAYTAPPKSPVHRGEKVTFSGTRPRTWPSGSEAGSQRAGGTRSMKSRMSAATWSQALSKRKWPPSSR